MIKAEFSEYLFIILFLAFSIISSLMNDKKKKQKQQNVRRPSNSPGQKRPNPFENKEEIKDIFDLMFSGPKAVQKEPVEESYTDGHLMEVNTGDNAARCIQ